MCSEEAQEDVSLYFEGVKKKILSCRDHDERLVFLKVNVCSAPQNKSSYSKREMLL